MSFRDLSPNPYTPTSEQRNLCPSSFGLRLRTNAFFDRGKLTPIFVRLWMILAAKQLILKGWKLTIITNLFVSKTLPISIMFV